METSEDVTELLIAWRGGDKSALSRLVPLVQYRLRQLARTLMRSERPDHTLQPTALVNELFLRMVGRPPTCSDRQHFFRITALVMDRVLIDHARRRRTLRRNGNLIKVPLEEGLAVSDPRICEEGLDLEQALSKLEALSPRQHRVLWLVNAAGLSVAEAAILAEVSEATARRDYRAALAFMRLQLGGEELGGRQ